MKKYVEFTCRTQLWGKLGAGIQDRILLFGVSHLAAKKKFAAAIKLFQTGEECDECSLRYKGISQKENPAISLREGLLV